MVPDEGTRSGSGSPGRPSRDGGADGSPRRVSRDADPDGRQYDSNVEAELDEYDDVDRDIDEADFEDDEAYRERDDFAEETRDDDEGGSAVFGLLSYLWMLVALALFAYLIHRVQAQASTIKTLQKRVAGMESRLGLQPVMDRDGL